MRQLGATSNSLNRCTEATAEHPIKIRDSRCAYGPGSGLGSDFKKAMLNDDPGLQSRSERLQMRVFSRGFSKASSAWFAARLR